MRTCAPTRAPRRWTPHAGPDGMSSLGFFVYGGKGADFALSNDDAGTLTLKSAEKTCLEISNKVPGASSAEALWFVCALGELLLRR